MNEKKIKSFWHRVPSFFKGKEIVHIVWQYQRAPPLLILVQLYRRLHFFKILGALFLLYLLFIQGKKFLNQNDVKFNFSVGHALVLFPFFFIINAKNIKWTMYVRPQPPPKFIYISIYLGYKILFSPNPMIIIKGCFRNTSNFTKRK